MRLTDEQKNVIKGILDSISSGKQVVRCGGFAGTGKSTLVYHLHQALPDSAVCAFTGKAADVLRKKHVPATTIHSLIYKPLMEDGKPKKDKHGNPIFVRSETLEADQIIVDEASMISKDLYEDLVSYKKPIIFVGDHGQLEPVGADINLMQYPDFTLEQIHRNAGEIAHFCSWIRQGYKPSAFARYIREGKVQFVNKFQAETYYAKANQIICAFNRTRVEVNYKTRLQLGFTEQRPQKNDRVMCLKNNNRIGLFNGMQGVISYIYKNNRFIFKTEDTTFDIIYDKAQFGQESYNISGGKEDPDPFDWCYCVTAHKCVDENTLIPTEYGLLPIGSLWDGKKESGLQEIKMTVASMDGKQTAIQLFKGIKEDAIKIKTQLGNELIGSYRHPVLVWDTKNCDFIWKKLPDVSVGDHVCISRNCGIFPEQYEKTTEKFSGRLNVKIPNYLNEDLGYLLGILVGDGHYAKNKSNMVIFTNQDEKVLGAFRKIVLEQFGLMAKKNNSKFVVGNPTETLYFCSSAVRNYLLSIGLDYVVREGKSVPLSILKSPLSVQANFIRGLFDADGSVDTTIRYVNVSRTLINQVQIMLMNMGIISIISSQFNKLTKKLYFTLGISGENMVLFDKIIGFSISYKLNRLKNRIRLVKGKTNVDFIPNLNSILDEVRKEVLSGKKRFLKGISNFNKTKNISYNHLEKVVNFLMEHIPNSPITKKLAQILEKHYFFAEVVEKTNTEAQMYDLSVPYNESFISNGIVSHNSQGSEWPIVLVKEQKSRNWDHRRWAYTAASRAKDLLIWETY